MEDIYKAIQDVIQFIENNLEEKITLDDLSGAANLSKYHLHRLFKAVSGKQLMSYVRGRKLAKSLGALTETGLRVIDIANEYGFEHQPSYIRSFKRQYHLSPAEYRSESKEVEIVEPLDLTLLHPLGKGIIMEPVFRIKPITYLVGFQNRICEEDNFHEFLATKAGVNFFYNYSHLIENAKKPEAYIGLTRFIEGEPNYSIYLSALETTDLEGIPEGMTGVRLSRSKYAVFKYIGLCPAKELTIEHLRHVYEYVFNYWLVHSGYKRTFPYHFEKIDARFGDKDYCEVEIYFPICEKALQLRCYNN